VCLVGCEKLKKLPDNLKADGWLDIDSNDLVRPHHQVRLRWRGVLVPQKVVLSPELLTTAEILNEPNAEVRRVMVERYGRDRFLRETTTVLDEDRDAGGVRQLLSIPVLESDAEPIMVCVSLTCPSTGRNYLLRVPPTMRTCRQAVAWSAGFDDPADYRPLMET
jgi:hypothetical protein